MVLIRSSTTPPTIQDMMQFLTLAAAAVCFGVGLTVLLSNPRRPSNHAFFVFSLLLTAWLCCVFGAILAGEARSAGLKNNLEFWFRANALISSFNPWGISFLLGAIVGPKHKSAHALRNSLPVLVIGLLLAAASQAKTFVIAGNDTILLRGQVYYVHTGVLVFLYIVIAIQIARKLRTQIGIRRLELQYLALSCGIGGLLNATLNGIGNFLHLRLFNRASIVVVLVAYLFMAWALAHHRIFNARHVLVATVHRLAVLAVLAILAWAVATGLSPYLDPAAAWVLGIVLSGMATLWFDHASRTWLGLGDEELLATVRGEVISISQRVTGENRTTAGFEALLASYHQSGFAAILSRHGEKFAGNRLEFSSQRPGFTALCDCAWITPESLQRRRSNPSLEDLGAYLEENSLGVMVAVPRGSPSPTLLVAIGTKKNEWPFTYPEVRRLQNVAELMDNILTRTRLSDQAALQTRLEHLAMMSRGLAHDLKNLITPISAFLVHTSGSYPPGSAEAEVHAAAQRSSRMITDYVREALFFSERLAPKFEVIDVARVLDGAIQANATRAKARGITLTTESGTMRSFHADEVLLQRMLANLVSNAIDASAPGQVVTITAQTLGPRGLRLQVSDHGCGIAPEVIERIFEPYFTTKEFGEEVRGFGLGLSIAQKIAQLHGGTIAVSSELERGTVMTVDLPETPGASPAPVA